MNRLSVKRCCNFLLLLTLLGFTSGASAWDAIGHRLSATIALHYLSEEKKALLLSILQQHPRYQQDFIAAMPDSIAQADSTRRLDWLFGQAAYWPDIARGLPQRERRKYNHPDWHYIDGAWVRGAAKIQGNNYVNTQRLPDLPGELATSIRNAAQVRNIVTALDYNTRLLAMQNSPAADKAVALCWVLHLMADIHQPLHAGSLFSATLFRDGDRGGNRIPTDDGNLHARWDKALAGEGLSFHRRTMLAAITRADKPSIIGVESDWSQWLNESREVLLTVVYSDSTRREIASAERENRRMRAAPLANAYLGQMKDHAKQRIQLAGLRLAIWFENELD